MALTQQQKNQHLLWRAGFGPAAEEFLQIKSASTPAYVEAIFKASLKPVQLLDVVDQETLAMSEALRNRQPASGNEMSAEAQRRQFAARGRQKIRTLNLAWLQEMVVSEAQLREKMSLFWHGHFACRNQNIFYNQQLLHAIRVNALGNFGDLLQAVSQSAAMLAFLNNQQNKKQSPNENFAREVMELFTMGRGNYTETDIKEAARAFTGWAFDQNGEFVFRRFNHDAGVKTVLGVSGNLTGEDVLEILLRQKQTARYITGKIFRYFVNENPSKSDEQLILQLADAFYASNYNIEKLMRNIFSAEWFYDEKNVGAKIKSPVELIAGIRRLLPMNIQNEEIQILFQNALGQLLFYPPNVAGWPGGKTWIDSSTLMLRLKIPQLIADTTVFSLRAKEDDDINMGMGDRNNAPNNTAQARLNSVPNRNQNRQQIRATIRWDEFNNAFSKDSRAQLPQHIAVSLLQVPLQTPLESILKFADQSSREEFIRSLTIQLMSTPEYQLC